MKWSNDKLERTIILSEPLPLARTAPEQLVALFKRKHINFIEMSRVKKNSAMAEKLFFKSFISGIFLFVSEIAVTQTFDWVKEIGADGSGLNRGYALETDNAENIYVTGTFHDTAVFDGVNVESRGAQDIFLAKYSGSGELSWVKAAGGTGFDGGTSLAVDSKRGRIIVTGFMYNAQFDDTTLSGSPYFISEYNTAGHLNWIKSISTTGGGGEPSAACDRFGNVMVTGGSFGMARLDSFVVYGPFLVVKLDRKGNVKWMKGIEPTSNSAAIQPSGIACDHLNNIYVTGFIQTDPIRFDSTHVLMPQQGGNLFLVKYDSDGHVIWALQSENTKVALASAISVDPCNHVCLTGLCSGYIQFSGKDSTLELSGTDSGNFFAVKYDSEGNPVWAVKSTESRYSSGEGIYADERGNVYVTGIATDAPRFDAFKFWEGGIFAAKYSVYGECLFAAIAGTIPGSLACRGTDIACIDSRDIFLTGYMSGEVHFGSAAVPENYRESVFIAKISTDEPAEQELSPYALLQNYPNPFKMRTHISFTILCTSFVTLKIYNILGELVATPASEVWPGGTHTVTWDAAGVASGIYICCLQAGTYSETNKLVVQN
jgi:hypothetical protein